jgi:hypothetical protein
MGGGRSGRTFGEGIRLRTVGHGDGPSREWNDVRICEARGKGKRCRGETGETE